MSVAVRRPRWTLVLRAQTEHMARQAELRPGERIAAFFCRQSNKVTGPNRASSASIQARKLQKATLRCPGGARSEEIDPRAKPAVGKAEGRSGGMRGYFAIATVLIALLTADAYFRR